MLKFILAIIEKSYMEEKMNIKKIKKVIAIILCLVMLLTFAFSNVREGAFSEKVSADTLPVQAIGGKYWNRFQ